MSGAGILTIWKSVTGPEQGVAEDPEPPTNDNDPVLLGTIKKYHFGVNTTPAVPSGTTQTIDLDEKTNHTLDLGSASGDVTLTLDNPTAGARYALMIIQGATPRDITWPANVKWPQGQKPLLSKADNAVDKVELLYDGTNYYGDWNVGYA
jgi:hypothetical protein